MRALDEYVHRAVPRPLRDLVQLRASLINGCAYCIDLHSREALEAGVEPQRVFALAAWRDVPFFDEAERAALALTDAVTALGEHGVPDEVWDAAQNAYGDKASVELLMAIVAINAWNRLMVAMRFQPRERKVATT